MQSATLAAPASATSTWAVQTTPNGLRLAEVETRAARSSSLTWAELLGTRLSTVRVFVLYFPSRFDLGVDTAVRTALEPFARQTSGQTLVSGWDPTDPHLEQALRLFDLTAPPALVLATGLKKRGKQIQKLSSLYAITITEPRTLGDRERLAAMVNAAHEVLIRGDAAAIASYLRKRDRDSLLASVASVGHFLVEQIATLKPKFQLPGGCSIQLG
jgi:hypothetical protein